MLIFIPVVQKIIYICIHNFTQILKEISWGIILLCEFGFREFNADVWSIGLTHLVE